MIINAKVQLNRPRILNTVENDSFGLFLANEWRRLITPYTPHRDGQLEQQVSLAPFEITYISPYSHYMYNGEIRAAEHSIIQRIIIRMQLITGIKLRRNRDKKKN